MKIYQRLEQLLKFRIYSNAEIETYLKKLSLMGKIDDVKKIALFNLILTVLGEMEDKEEERKIIEMKPPTITTTSTPTDIQIQVMDPVSHPSITDEAPFKCPECPMVAKTKLGLISHSRKHKK